MPFVSRAQSTRRTIRVSRTWPIVQKLEHRTLLAVAPLGPEYQINTFNSGVQTAPALAIEPDGDYVAVWTSFGQDGSGAGVYGQRFNAAGVRQGPEFRVNESTPDNQSQPEVAVDVDGDFVVVWTSEGQDGSSSGVYGRRFDAGGQPRGPEFRVNTTTAGPQLDPDVASTPDGKFVVTWEGTEGVYLQRYDAAGARLGGEVRINNAPDDLLLSPHVAVGPGETSVVSWLRLVPPTPVRRGGSIWFQRFDAAGAEVGDETQVATVGISAPNTTDVGVDAAGNFVVAWDEFNYGVPSLAPYALRARRYSPAGLPRGDAILVSATFDKQYNGESSMGLSVRPTGEFVVACDFPDGDRNGVFARAYDSAGVPHTGSEIRANSVTAGSQAEPSVAATPDGGYLVAWAGDRAATGGSSAIKAQRYAPVQNPATVGDRVWNDTNQNNVQDPGEPGIDGIRVDLYLVGGAQVNSSYTANGGLYRFDNLSGGDESYGLRVTAPPLHNVVAANQGDDDAADSDVDAAGWFTPFTVPAAQTDLTLDAGLVPPASFEGTVWGDADADGIQDAGENGRDGVAVELLNGDGVVLRNTQTANGGVYRFMNLSSGTYRLRFRPPAGLFFTARDQGTNDALDSDPDSATGVTAPVTLLPGQNDVTRDAGLAARTAFTGTALRDVVENGLKDEFDSPLYPWTVFADGNGNDVLDAGEAWTSTDEAGNYTLQVPPGTHRVSTVLPDGWTMLTPVASRTANLAPGALVAGADLVHAAAGPQRHATPVGPEFRVNTATAGTQSRPAVAGNGSGQSVVVWFATEPGATTGHVHGQRLDAAGDPVGGEFQVSTTPVPASAGMSSVAMGPGGGFLVAWQGQANIYARRFDAAGAPLGGEFVANADPSGVRSSPRVAFASDGDFAIAWSGNVAGDPGGTALRLFDATGSPRGAEFRVNETPTSSTAEWPGGLAFDSAGVISVVFNSGTSSAGRVFLRRFAPDGAPLGPQRNVSTVAGGGHTDAAVATNAAGDTLVAWVHNFNVYGRLFDAAGTPKADMFGVSTQRGALAAPSVAAGSDGAFLVTWSDANASPYFSGRAVRGQLVSARGVPNGREFRVNTASAASPSSPGVAAGPEGSYLATWAGGATDGSDGRIRAQRLTTFGDAERIPVGDFVWDDADGDGIQEAGEAGLDGALVELYSAAGSIVDTALTARGGAYRFSSARAGESYRVRFASPAGKLPSPPHSTNDAADSDADRATGFTPGFTVGATGDLTIDAGMIPGARISGVLFRDLDGDGTRDANEPSLSDWVVFLDRDGDGGLDGDERRATTGTDGGYSFAQLVPEPHQVAVVLYSHWRQTTRADALRKTPALGQSLTGVDAGVAPDGPTDLGAAPEGPQFPVNVTTAGQLSWPTVASDAAGNFVAVWVAPGSRLFARRFAASGAPLAGEVLVSGDALDASVAADDQGNFVVAWTTTGSAVYARRYDAAGVPAGAAFGVSTVAGFGRADPDVAADADGDFVVTWSSIGQDGDGAGVYARRYDRAGGPRGAEFVVNDVTTGDQNRPAVASDAGGAFVVTYLSGRSTGAVHVAARRFDAAGAPAGAEFRVTPERGFTQHESPDVAMNASGEFVIAYGGFDASGRGVEARRYDAVGAPQGPGFVVNTSTYDYQGGPSVAMADDGTFVVAWTDLAADPDGIRAQAFTAAGTRLGEELIVNSAGDGRQYGVSVAAQPGGFVATWVGLNANAAGVSGQRFITFGDAASIGGVAFADANDNGVFDPGEAGRDNVPVRLVDSRGVIVARAGTSDGGRYRFDGLRPGASFVVEFLPPHGFTFAHPDRGGDEATDSDADPATGRTAPFVPAPDGMHLTLNAGLIANADLSGRLFHDANANGTRDGGEGGLAGWTVFLDTDRDGAPDAGEPAASTTADGAYAFPSLRPGQYRLGIVQLQRWQLTTSSDRFAPVLRPGESLVADFGYRPTAPVTYARPVGPELSVEPSAAWWNERTWDYFDAGADGSFVVVAESFASNQNSYVVSGRKYDPSGNPVGDVFTLQPPAGASYLSPSVSVAPDGRFVLVWWHSPSTGSPAAVRAQRFSAAGAKEGPEIVVNTTPAIVRVAPSVSVDPTAGFVVAWEGSDANGSGIVARRFDASGAPLTGEVPVNERTNGNQTLTDVVTDAAGNFAVLWSGTEGSQGWSWDLRLRRFAADGTPLGGEVDVSPHAPSAGIAMNAAGELVVTALILNPESPNSLVHLAAFRYDAAGVQQGREVRVTPSWTARASDVALHDDGSFVVVWQDADGDGTGVFSRRFTGSGLPAGPAVRISPTTAAEQVDPLVAALPGGSFVTAYHHGVSGTSTTNRVQRYDAFTSRSIVGGFVWNDDGDGVREAGEAPAAGVPVELLTIHGSVAATAVTGADGGYRFDVFPGTNYVLRYVLPAGRVPTLQDQGSDDAADSDARPLAATTDVAPLPSGQADLTYGLGFVTPSSIAGAAYFDRDRDGSRGAGEEGLAGWTVFLDADDDGRLDADERSAVTAAGGAFSFANLSPGVHRLGVILQNGWAMTTPPAGRQYTLVPGQSLTGASVGLGTAVLDSKYSTEGPEFPVSTSGGGARVAVGPNGDAVVVWLSGDGDGEGVFARRFDARGNALGGEIPVNQYTAGTQRFASVAVDADGDFVVAWESENNPGGSGWDVYARRFSSAGVPRGDEFRVNTNAAGSQNVPDVASDASGNFVVTWKHWNGGLATDARVQRFDAAGDRVGDEVAANSRNHVQDPAIAMNAGGAFVVTWMSVTPDGLHWEIDAQRFNAAAQKVGEQFQVNSHTQNDQMDPDVAIDDAGNFMIVWMSRSDGRYRVAGQRYDADGVPQGAEMVVGPSTQFPQAQVAMAGQDGSFAVTWAGYNGLNNDSFVRRYSAAGVPDGDVAQVGSDPSLDDHGPAVGMDRRGNFLVAWQHTPTPGAGYVRAQRYAVDQAPKTSGMPDVSVNTGAPNTVIDLHSAFADDRDADNQLTYTVRRNTNPSLFDSTQIDPAGGTLTLDYADGASGVAEVTVRATDRSGLSNQATFAVRVGAPPPAEVTDVFVNGSSWPAGFRQHLAAEALGEVAYGFRLPAVDRLNELPWQGIDRISLRFTRDVRPDEATLRVIGSNGEYQITRFSYDPATRTATWTLSVPLSSSDRVVLQLDGGAGVAGRPAIAGEEDVVLNVLAGDVNRDGRVSPIDLAQVRSKLMTSTVRPGIGSKRYTPFHDVNGDGRINLIDYALVRANQARVLPQTAAPPPASPAVSTASATSGFFGSTPILPP